MLDPCVAPTSQLVVEIFVRNLAYSIAFYQELGFELLEERGSFAVFGWDGHELFLDERPDLAAPTGAPRANVRVMVPDVDDWWKRANEMGAVVSESIGGRDYGLRDFTVVDPDGFGIRFGSYIDGARRSE